MHHRLQSQLLQFLGWDSADDMQQLFDELGALDLSRSPHVRTWLAGGGAWIASVATAYQQLEQELTRARDVAAQQDARLQALDSQKFALDQHAILSMTDAQGRIVYANSKFCDITGFSADEWLGQTHRLIDSGVHDKAFYTELWSIASAQRVWQGEICYRNRTGDLFWVASTVVPMPDAQGRTQNYIVISTDITPLKEAAQVLQAAKEAAETANRAKSEFLANMSHEIRTPMNGIIGMTELALGTELNDEQREYLQTVRTSADALLTIINDILDFSNIEAGKLTLECIPFHMGRLISETLRVLGVRAYQKGVELLADLPLDPPGRVLGDPVRLRQVLINLVGNAIKFTAQGEVEVHLKWKKGPAHTLVAHVAVRDTGIGIAPDKQALIFEAFSQEDASTTRHYGGTGLGLSISKRLVELMGGEIALESELGRGSTFHFTVQLQWEPEALVDQPRLAAVSLEGKRVLVVDDNATNRTIYTRLLQRWGMQVDAVHSGPLALQWLARSACDVVLLDCHMPGMDGFDVARQLHLNPPLAGVPPMIMLSSAALGGESQRCQALGIGQYYAKPVATEDLLAALQKALQTAAPARPSAVEVAAKALAPAVGGPVQAGRPLKVLLVEDQPVNQKLALALLRKWGHDVTVAQDGQAALDSLTQGATFDVILMDLQMPVMGGLEATRRIRAREALTPGVHQHIIAMTANAMKDDEQLCRDAGMDDYISKPIDAKALFLRLAAL